MEDQRRQRLAIGAETDALGYPSRAYARPTDVLTDASLTREERRAILSAWASDACAVTSNPPLRRLPFSPAPVTFDEIMDAMLDLDRSSSSAMGTDGPSDNRPVHGVLSYCAADILDRRASPENASLRFSRRR